MCITSLKSRQNKLGRKHLIATIIIIIIIIIIY